MKNNHTLIIGSGIVGRQLSVKTGASKNARDVN